MTKRTSKTVAAIAADYVNVSASEISERIADPGALVRLVIDVRALAASALAQREPEENVKVWTPENGGPEIFEEKISGEGLDEGR